MKKFEIRALKDWKLCACFANEPFLGNSVETGIGLNGIIPWIDATVPGSVYQDLLRAKLIEDPFYELNSLKCEWVNARWWIYATTISVGERFDSMELVLEGIDYHAHIYLNGEKIGEHEGMFCPCVLNVKDKLKQGENRINVFIENAPHEQSQIGYTSRTQNLKSRFNYKWDFCTRLINLGLYGNAYLRVGGKGSIADYHFCVAKPARLGKAELFINTNAIRGSACSVKIELSRNDEIYCKAEQKFVGRGFDYKIAFPIEVQNPEIWHCNGNGAQALYDLKITMLCGEMIVDEKIGKVGFKDIELVANENALADALNYTFVLNGVKTYIKGVNFTPMDMMTGCVTRERYENFLKQMQKTGINLIRVWGGGVIESEDFYELCDEYGFMVWQEFNQSSSGLDNTPSKHSKFLSMLASSAKCAVKIKRNHAALCVWSGGNELCDENNIPSTFGDLNLAMLRGFVADLNPEIPMLPTSASGPHESASTEWLGENYDVHGPWKYLGEESQYKFYNSIDSLFHSEFGVDGLSEIGTLKKILSPENQLPTRMIDNHVWRHHGDWWCTYDRETEIFGELESLEQFAVLSQFMQAEGLRYALEANRRRAFQNSGSIVWQANEPYPNVSCTCLVDYYGNPKRALKATEKAFSRLNVSLKYNKLCYEKGENIDVEVFVTSDDNIMDTFVAYKVSYDNNLVLSQTTNVSVGEGKTTFCGKINLITPETSLIKIAISAKNQHATYSNEIILLQKGKSTATAVINWCKKNK